MDGFNRANGGTDQVEQITEQEFDDMLQRHEQFIARRM